jgi:hypothetical protein
MIIKESKASPYFTAVDISKIYNRNTAGLKEDDCSSRALEIREQFLTGDCVLNGIPFKLGDGADKNNVLLLNKDTVEFALPSPIHGSYIIFLHTADLKKPEPSEDGIFRPMMGNPQLGEEVCKYVLKYGDGNEYPVEVRRRFNINEFSLHWGNGSFECVPHYKPLSLRTATDDFYSGRTQKFAWGESQTRATSGDERSSSVIHWLYALENPYPEKELSSISFIGGDGTAFVFGVTVCNLESNPLVWESRKKIKLALPAGMALEEKDLYEKVNIDLGQIISVSPTLEYSNGEWEKGYNNKQPAVSGNTVIIEYTAHPAACLYLGGDEEVIIPLNAPYASSDSNLGIQSVNEAKKPVTLKVIDKKSGRTVPVKLHVHGQHGEYLAPVNRHRIPNPYWFEDYSTDFVHGRHFCTYIDGEAVFKLPFGEIYMEVSKGFEVQPLRKTFTVDANTDSITLELDNVLNWREKGWVTADTHVHFLSPQTALLEGEAEGVNVVNLLASQWGELFTNIGDFDGKTTIGSAEAGGTGEFLVRVGTENRQHILGHISLLGYEGRMILPLTTGGPDESALGDPVEETLSGWAEKCRKQNGISILPHFPNPRAEGAAAMILEMIDGVEMTSWGDHYSGISPYSLSDWYRYLNCGYQVPAVGGTDKMSADTAVGTVRTYALIKNAPFTFDTWKDAVRKGITFATYGPLVEFHANGREMGSRIDLPKGGGTVDIDWHVCSVTVPVSKIELIINGETREVKTVNPADGDYYGRWSVKMAESGWIALRIRGCYPDKPEMIAAHTSSIMILVDGKKCFQEKDATTILDQIEGAAAYVRSLGTKAEQEVFNRVLLTLTSAHRALHNRLHQEGAFHRHTVVDDHHKK